MIGAGEAFTLGLVNYVSSPGDLMIKTFEILNKIYANGPRAVTGIINCVDAYFQDGVDGSAFEVEEFGNCFGTDGFTEGVDAFLSKRKANFR